MEQQYIQVLGDLKEKIRHARQKIANVANSHLLEIYWEIGHTISTQILAQGWGAKVIDRLVNDLKIDFPDMTGLSPRNLRYMRSFAEAYPQFLQPSVANLETIKDEVNTILQPLVAKLPWTHHTIILDKLKVEQDRVFYIQKCIENGWSKNVLILQIDNQLHKRQGQAITNFDQTLPKPQSDLAREMLKNPYLLDFISVEEGN